MSIVDKCHRGNQNRKGKRSLGTIKENTKRVTYEQRPEMGREPARAMTLRQNLSGFEEEKVDVAGVS